MKLESLINFFKHVSQRETSHGIPNAFKFKNVLSSCKNGVLQPARYREEGENNSAPVPRKRQKPAREVNLGTTVLYAQAETTISSVERRSASMSVPSDHHASANIEHGLNTPANTPARPRKSRISISNTPGRSQKTTTQSKGKSPKKSKKTRAKKV